AFNHTYYRYRVDTLECAVSASLAWHTRGSWRRTYFIDYHPGNNDAATADRFCAELRAVTHPADGRVVTVGAEGARSDVTSDIFGDHSQNELAAYGESAQRFGRARVTAGAALTDIAGAGG